MQNVDIPSIDELLELSEERGMAHVSIYIGTSPIATKTPGSKIELKNALAEAERTLREQGVPALKVQDLSAQVHSLLEDDEFWWYQSRSLAVFVTPTRLRRYRLPNRLSNEVTVNDRFRLGQLLRSVTFPHAAYVLVLSEKDARLVEVGADVPPRTLDVDGLPPDPTVLKRTSLADQAPMPRSQGRTGDRVEQQKYARLAQDAILPVIRGSGLPLILAAAEPIAPAYQAINSYAHFADEVIEGNYEDANDEQLAQRARPILDRLYHEQLEQWRDDFGQFESEGRATTDMAAAARAATFGAVDSVMIDMDTHVFGTIAEDDGALQFGDESHPGDYSILDEIAARVLRSSGRVLSVRSGDLPNGSPVAAILRYGV